MNVNTQLLSQNVGQQIINRDNINILDLDREEIINLFKSYGVLLLLPNSLTPLVKIFGITPEACLIAE